MSDDAKHVDDDYSDDDIEVAPKARGGLTSAASVGKGLAVKDDKLRMAASGKNLKAAEEAEARGTDVALRFHLPGGKTLESTEGEGQVVVALKAFLAENSDLPIGGIVLTLGGTVLLDPMSLCDYPAVRARKGALDIEVRTA